MTMPYVPALEAELVRLQIPSDVKVYPGAGHSFMNAAPNPVLGFVARNSPMHAGYDASAARDAMNRLVTFFAAHV
jgi:carboxymethylenebutenolidase